MENNVIDFNNLDVSQITPIDRSQPKEPVSEVTTQEPEGDVDDAQVDTAKESISATEPSTSDPISFDRDAEVQKYLQEKFQLESPSKIEEILKENQTLKQRVEEKPKLDFPNEQAKRAYEWASKFKGAEDVAFKQYLHVQSLDLEQGDPKQVLFEAYKLKNQDLSEADARELFEDEYSKKYEDAFDEDEPNRVAQIAHKRDLNAAKEELRKIQDEFNAPSEMQVKQDNYDQVIQEFSKKSEAALQDFMGVQIPFTDDENQDLKVEASMEELNQIKEYVTNPNKFFMDFIGQFQKGDDFDHTGFVQAVYEFQHRDKIQELSYKHGVQVGELKKLTEAKNPEKPIQPNTPQPKKESLLEAWQKAVLKS
jgi:hypothetical protein